MSKPLFPDRSCFPALAWGLQIMLAPLDGHFNSDVSHAEDALAERYEAIKREMGNSDARSEACISTLEPDAQRKSRQFLKAANALPLTYKIISGTRTVAEQDELFAQGRTKPGKIVTKAEGGESNHNFGIAWDIRNLRRLADSTHGRNPGRGASLYQSWKAYFGQCRRPGMGRKLARLC